MTQIMRALETEPKHNRVICLALDGDDMFFAIIIKRIHRGTGEHYWCLYRSLDSKQYNYLCRLDDDELDGITFLGVGSDSITVPKILCDMLLLDQPKHFAGIDLPRDINPQVDDSKLFEMIRVFCDETQVRLAGVKEVTLG